VIARWVRECGGPIFSPAKQGTRFQYERLPQKRRSVVHQPRRGRALRMVKKIEKPARKEGSASTSRPPQMPGGLRIWCGATVDRPISKR
jgi:hypothetical protein